MPSKKVLIMLTRSQPLPQSVPPDSEGSVLAPGPVSPSDIRSLHIVLDIQKSIGRVEHTVESLEYTSKSHGEKLQEIIRQADRTEDAQLVFRESMALHGDRIRTLERIARLGEFLVGVGILGYLLHRFAPFLFPK